MEVFSKSKWIWIHEGESEDQYALFKDEITYSGGKMAIRISCDSDYTLFIGDTYVASGQYGDFEHYKIYDTIDITPFLKEGNNTLSFTVHHCGTGTLRYRPAKAGLIYEVISDDKIVAISDENTLCKLHPFYMSGRKVLVTMQLGYSFLYDSTADDREEFKKAALVDKKCSFYERPIKKSAVLPKKEMAYVIKKSDTHYLIDLGGEVVGLPKLDFSSEREQMIRVAWGEHITDGGVRQIIASRNFSYEYKAHAGKNDFTEYMLRLGCRYIEVFSEYPIELEYAGVLPQVYEVEVLPVKIEDTLDRNIYDVCVNTLKLCMMEHFVDCPWREQALYSFDSRNQMLFGYYAFKDFNREYVRANLKLMGMDRRDDGYLSITYPCGVALVIPSFTLHYVASVWEYTEYTGDTSLGEELLPKLKSIIETFLKLKNNGLICVPKGVDYWNFYDWSEKADLGKNNPSVPDALINSLFVIALDSYEKICASVGKETEFAGLKTEIANAMRAEFLCDDGLFTLKKGEDAKTELVNSLAVISGAATEDETKVICEHLAKGSLAECTFSNKIFVYQVLMETDKEKYRDFILGKIRKDYKRILDTGSDTIWEVPQGEAGFDGAGSLCHGWASIPIYIYHKFGVAEYLKKQG